ncbi:hypothetical protein KC331_g7998 [Hortaea werneckii]|uniref:Uncharacterized protein n=1 Tax=Hortaea werneckii TaxID=91943 RepID=A0A3M7BKQ1_HORWE|nr:hypothetical protein KC331_g7998 [Hortaea werneckii]KAI7716100.1 hypothetical protein KC353_g5626 [Hortaea werneckii]RMY40361.1 hypothetical protein D0865_12582 [Hortaea werneckii]
MPLRLHRQSYRNLDGVNAEKNAVGWYWRAVAIGSSIIILGGYLILPVTFHHDDGLRVSKSALGIFAVALLTAGFSFTVLLCFAVRNPVFQAESVFLPCLISCAIGLLTIFYDFLISSKFYWNTPALLSTVAASITTIAYSALLIFSHRRIGVSRRVQRAPSMPSISMPARASSMSSSGGAWQDPTYQENYVRNMHPTSLHTPQPMGYDPNSITEEEMQRQQMLMLLLQKEQPATPDPSQSTFRIDWQGREEDDAPPNGYYAPQTPLPQTAYQPHSQGVSMQWTGELRPWDGVWRGGAPPSTAAAVRGRTSSPAEQWDRATSWERREERRREIEMGR